MSENNIDLFNRSTAQIFAELYKNFPIPASITYEDITGERSKHQDVMDYGVTHVTHNREEVHDATVEWLAETGFITLDGNARRGYATLSFRGLEVLKLVPHEVSEGSYGDQLVREATKGAVSAGSGELASGAMTMAMRIFSGYFTGG